MRALALILVLANFGVFGWTRWVAVPEADVTPPRTLGPQVERLALVAAPAAAPGSPSGLADGAGDAMADPQTGAGEEGAPAVATTPPANAARDVPPAEREVGRDGDDAETTGASASESAVPDVVLAGAQLVVIAPPDSPPLCASIGPFLDIPSAADLSAELRSRALVPKQRVLESDVWVGYAVLLAPAPTRAEALAVTDRLKARGIEDLYVIPSGDQRNAVSLGLFSERRRAERRVAQLRELGFDPQIQDRTRTATVYFVDFEVPSGQRVDLSRFERPGRRLTNGECVSP
jgi:hypothetical protein